MRFTGNAAKAGSLWAALVLASSLVAACGDDDDGSGVEYFPAGGVSEEMRLGRSEARLNLGHTVVTVLEAAGGHGLDTGGEDGVDEFAYHFDQPTELRLSLGEFDGDAPTIVALDGEGNEMGRVHRDSPEISITVSGEQVFRFVHPRAGDSAADPILFFFQPLAPETSGGADASLSGANSDDVATLKADKSCFRCNFKGLSWNACPGVALSGINLSNSDFTGAILACQMFEPKDDTPVLLTGANFTDAKLSELLFTGVDLTDAVFTGAFFDVTVFDSVTATSANFSNSKFMNSTFGAAKGSGSSARGANFSGAQIINNSCLSTYDLRDADFSGATFDSSSSVHGTWFAGANLHGVSFDGTQFQYDSTTLPDCGQSTSCTTVSVSDLCDDCPCRADFGCLELGGGTECVRNQGAVSLPAQATCERQIIQAPPQGPLIADANLLDVSFAGADLNNATFTSNSMDSGNDFDGAILNGVDFTQQNLGKAVDLSGAYLDESTDFTGATLTDAPSTQRGVILSCDTETGTGGCDFATTTTEFKGADLRYAELDNVDLSQVDLEGVNLANASLLNADLTFANLKGANLTGARLGSAQASGTTASLRGAYMINVDLTDADLRSVDFTGAHLYGAQSDALFVRAKLDSADFTDAILAGAVFTNASMTAATFNGAQLVNASFEGATLTNAKFDDAYLQGADFSTAASITGISLSNSAVATDLTSTMCDLVAPGTWTYMDQDGVPYTYAFEATALLTDSSVVCPDNKRGPCDTGDSLCPVMSGPFPPIPTCVPVRDYCYENCLDPPCFLDVPDPDTGLCPLFSNCS